MQSLELKIPPAVVVLSFGLAMWLVARFVAVPTWPSSVGRPLGMLLIATGFAVAMAGVREFRRARTTVNPLKPDAASALVTSGVFRYSRNPMYLGMLLVLAGWAALLGNPVATLMLIPFVLMLNSLQIEPEERVIAARFGAEFASYRRRVRRWI